ncbi:MAG: hypothetical protein EOO09_13975 [Chitinophagaceae bacterium]|nr:MAG: hypothetical protein EOO09_13975 [Chitinophagaceae bacterium]
MNNVVGVDQFGRSFSTITSSKTDKKVGLFFWLWIGQPYASNVYDCSKILDMPNGLKILTHPDFQNEAISPTGQAHFWGEPLWGYYNSDDGWVLRKQVEMLTTAGIDFIFFDATNAFIYKSVYEKLLGIIDEYQKRGWNPPKVAFYTHSRSFQTIRELFRELYKPNLYADTWYKVDGKPMIIGYTDPNDDLKEAQSRGDNTYTPGTLTTEILNYFHFEYPQWPSDPVFYNGFPWVEWIFPQPMHNRTMNVTVASHPSVPMSFSLTKGLVNWGRGWDPDTKTNNPSKVDEGSFFQRQWDHAITSNPDLITVGGWNEWIAYKQPYWDEYVLVDAVNKEYSRDIEPMSGGYEDAFYIQMIKNIRRYKGVSGATAKAKKTTIDISKEASQWNSIPATAVNINTERSSRNAYGATTKLLYSAPAATNHLKDIKVAQDATNIYFYVRSRTKFSNPSGASWLNILVGTGDPSPKAWESYEYRIGESFSAGTASVGKLNADFTSTASGSAKYTLKDDVLQIEVPKASVGLSSGNKFYFKVATSIEKPAEIMSYYTSGVSMPMGRLSYMYEFE